MVGERNDCTHVFPVLEIRSQEFLPQCHVIFPRLKPRDTADQDQCRVTRPGQSPSHSSVSSVGTELTATQPLNIPLQPTGLWARA